MINKDCLDETEKSRLITEVEVLKQIVLGFFIKFIFKIYKGSSPYYENI